MALGSVGRLRVLLGTYAGGLGILLGAFDMDSILFVFKEFPPLA